MAFLANTTKCVFLAVALAFRFEIVLCSHYSTEPTADSVFQLIEVAIKHSDAGKYDLAESILLNAENASSELENDTLLAQVFYNLGLVYGYSNQPIKAIENHRKALEIREITDSVNLIAQSYQAIGDVYFYHTRNMFEAKSSYFSALEMIKSLNDKNTNLIAIIYGKLASVYRIEGDADLALNYIDTTLNYLHSVQSKDDRLLATSYMRKANIFYAKMRLDSAIIYYHKALDLDQNLDKNEQSTIYLFNIATCFSIDEKYDSAIYYSHRALELSEKLNYSAGIANAYLALGEAFIYSANKDSAHYYLSKSLNLREEIFEDYYGQTASVYVALATLHWRSLDFDSALSFMQKAINSLFPEIVNPNDIFVNPPKDLLVNDEFVLNLLAKKGDILVDYYKHSNTAIRYLEHALETYTLAIHIFTISRKSFQEEGSTLFSLDHYYPIIESGLECLYLLNQSAPSHRFSHKALQFMEMGRAVLLVESLNRIGYKSNFGLPDSLLVLESKLKNQLTFARQMNDTVAVDSLINSQHNLINQIAENFPSYYQTNYSNTEFNVHQLQDHLQSDEMIIEYFWGDSTVYMLGVTRDNSHLLSVKKDSTLIAHYINALRTPPKFENKKSQLAQFTQYCNLASQVYDKYFSPIVPSINLKIKKLTIVPDGLLTYLPFEAIISDTPTSDTINYQDLVYLIKTYKINYAYSASWFMQLKSASSPLFSPKVLAFSHGNVLEGELTGTDTEVAAIETSFPGRYFRGKEASKKNFLMNTQGYDIIHLAMHGQANTEEKNSGILIFHDSNKYDTLYIDEIYDLPLTNSITILTACESGIGKLYRGEGVYSMARAFAYKGSKSIVTSQWKISDKTTSTIVQSMYQNVRNHTIAQALHQAKLEYINDAKGLLAHPSQWAGLLAIGDTMIVNKQYNKLIIALSITLFLVAATYSVYFTRRRSKFS